MPDIAPFFLAAEIPFMEPSEKDWLVPGIVPKDGLVILASAPKTGKTCFATALARAVATGAEFLGKPTPQHPVLWCAHEETWRERQELHRGLTFDDPFYVGYTGELPFLDTPEPKRDRYGRYPMGDMDPPYVFYQATEIGAKLIVIDCLHAAVDNVNLAENKAARFVMGRLRRWSYHFHIPVLVLHHLTKSATRGHHPERFADSAQILAAASCHFFMERHELETGESRIILYGRGRYPAPFSRLELRSRGILDFRLAEDQHPMPVKPTVEDRVLAALDEGENLTAAQLSRQSEAAPSTVRAVLHKLIQEERVALAKSADRTPRYRLVE